MSGPTVEKQIAVFLDKLAALPDYRAERWVLTKPDIALLTRYSQHVKRGNASIEWLADESHPMHVLAHGLAQGYIGITAAHEYEGLAWLWSQHKKGWLGARELRLMKQCSHFTLAGVHTEMAGMHALRSTPVWRVHGLDGTHFSYEGWAWQSGQKPRIVV